MEANKMANVNNFSTQEDIENLLDIFSNNQVKVGDLGNIQIKSEEVLLSESQEKITLYATTEERTAAEVSLNSSGYQSASSPPEPLSAAVSPRPNVRLVHVRPPELPSLLTDPDWLQRRYPELYTAWHLASASQLYQGGVTMLCSTCKKHPAIGFHEGLPLCEACRVGVACTVCRIRVASCFSYGLALCEADRIFLYRTFNSRTQFSQCQTLCPVTVQKWCGYCRLRTCLSTKGFRFYIQGTAKQTVDNSLANDRGMRKRKFSGQEYGGSSRGQNPGGQFAPGTSYQTAAPAVQQQQVSCYDGSGLGLSSRRQQGSYGVATDPRRGGWVAQQQEKYLQHHLALYRARIRYRE